MSRLLRRIKRSRTAADGDPPADQQAAGAEAASTTTTTGEAAAPAGDVARTAVLPAATAPPVVADPDGPAGLEEGAAAAPVVADPDRPAGLEEGAAAAPPAGRRGRLRRRLRYLRRARELMLRDLGGISYEVHRTGGGDYTAHAGVIGGKVERLARLDDEAHAIEQALGAPRSAAVVFEPGIGGTCDVCGELFGSAARFCSHCGSSTDPAARPAAPVEAGTAARPVPPMPKAPGSAETQVLAAPAGKRKLFGKRPKPAAVPVDEPVTQPEEAGAEPAPAAKPAEEENLFARWPSRPAEPSESAPAAAAPDDATAVTAATEADAAPADAPTPPAGEPEPEPRSEPPNPPAGSSNGRAAGDTTPPDLSSGDPLATRETRQ